MFSTSMCACRSAGLPAAMQQQAALTGLGLLLLRMLLRRDTAVGHVRLEVPLTPLAAPARHWRRLELAGWHAQLRRTAERAAAGAHWLTPS